MGLPAKVASIHVSKESLVMVMHFRVLGFQGGALERNLKFLLSVLTD